MEKVISMKQVKKQYKKTQVIQGLELTIDAGSTVALLGPNGAGKTTTISMILGLIEPSSGEIRIMGQAPSSRAVRERIGVMLQEVSVMDGLKVKEILNLFRSYYKRPMSLEQLLIISGLEKEANRFAEKLSGGQKRKLSFAQALAGDPELLFLDEPTVGLDTQMRKKFWEVLRVLASKGKTILFTTHYLEEADANAKRVVVLHQGKIIADGTPGYLKQTALTSTVSFTSTGPVSQEAIKQLPIVIKLDWEHTRKKVYVTSSDEFLKQLFDLQLDIKDIEVSNGRLEDAFELLTAEDVQAENGDLKNE
jgi:ABC-2 type transport system ATP-binding protein